MAFNDIFVVLMLKAWLWCCMTEENGKENYWIVVGEVERQSCYIGIL